MQGKQKKVFLTPLPHDVDPMKDHTPAPLSTSPGARVLRPLQAKTWRVSPQGQLIGGTTNDRVLARHFSGAVNRQPEHSQTAP
jgi:hypothetical protein